MVAAVTQIRKVWQVVTEDENFITVTATADEIDLQYGWMVEGLDLIGVGINDTVHVIAAIQAASDWVEERSKEDNENNA